MEFDLSEPVASSDNIPDCNSYFPNIIVQVIVIQGHSRYLLIIYSCNRFKILMYSITSEFAGSSATHGTTSLTLLKFGRNGDPFLMTCFNALATLQERKPTVAKENTCTVQILQFVTLL